MHFYKSYKGALADVQNGPEQKTHRQMSSPRPTDKAMALEAMERCISDLRKWMYRDKLKINDDKTEFLVIGSRQQLLKIRHCSVRVGTIDIKPVKVERNLSASLDSHFSMSTHIS